MPTTVSAVRHDRDQRAPSFDLRVVDPTSDDCWDALIATHPQSSIFHTAAWARVLSDSYGHKPVYLSFSQLGKPAVLLPIMEVVSSLTGRRGVSLPFSDFANALFFEGFGMKSIGKHLSTLVRERRWKYLEVRGGSEFCSCATTAPTFYGHTLQLDGDPQKLRTGFIGAVRRNLGTAERSGLKVQVTWAREAVFQFYQLHVRTRRRHGAPPQPVRFFDDVYRHLIEPGLGFVILAGPVAKPVAAAVFLTHGKNAVYKFGASDAKYQQYRANNLVMWEAIKHLSERGATSLHFGRTSPDNDGLRRFKRGWGGREEAIHHCRLDSATDEWEGIAPDSSSIAQHVFRRLPSAVNRWAGAFLYPHLD
ncbi:MAG: GNAT family N-acetyltransferase [Verrucomicrobiota bacterium]